MSFVVGTAVARTTSTAISRRRTCTACRQFSSKGKSKDLSPLPPPPPQNKPKQPLSSVQAKQQYLKSKDKLGIDRETTNDPMAKMAQLNKELDIVRERAAAKLDKELNKSVYRKLTDPLRRYKHSVVNMVAVTLAYILAHNLFLTSQKEKKARAALESSQEETQNLKGTLANLLSESTVQSIASACVEEVARAGPGTRGERERKTSTSTSSSWWWNITSSQRRRGRLLLGVDDADRLQQRLVEVLQQELDQRIGEQAMNEEQRKQKVVQEIWKENQSQVEALNENPERILEAFLQQQEEEYAAATAATAAAAAATNDGQPKPQRRVFSM